MGRTLIPAFGIAALTSLGQTVSSIRLKALNDNDEPVRDATFEAEPTDQGVVPQEGYGAHCAPANPIRTERVQSKLEITANTANMPSPPRRRTHTPKSTSGSLALRISSRLRLCHVRWATVPEWHRSLGRMAGILVGTVTDALR